MYGSKSPPADETLHEPWAMPANVDPNYCPPSCSILLNPQPEEEEPPRRMGFIGRRRSSKSSVSGKPTFAPGANHEQHSPTQPQNHAHHAAGIFSHINPFGAGPSSRVVEDIIREDIPVNRRESVQSNTSDWSDSTGGAGLRRRESSLKFGLLPERPPEFRRNSSISLGVASRKNLLLEQNGGSPRSSGSAGSAGGPTPPKPARFMSDDSWNAYKKRYSASSASSNEPDTDIAETVTSGVKSFWKKVKPHHSPTPTSSRLPPSPIRSVGGNMDRRGSAPVLNNTPFSMKHPKPGPSPLHSPLASPLVERDDPITGLPAVREETPSGTNTPSGRQVGPLSMERISQKLGVPGAAILPPRKEPPNSGLSIEIPTASQPARRISEPVVNYQEWAPRGSLENERDAGTKNDIKHPDPAVRQPSPPPSFADRSGFPGDDREREGEEESEIRRGGLADDPADSANSTPLTSVVTPSAIAPEPTDQPQGVSPEVTNFFEKEVQWNAVPDIGSLSLATPPSAEIADTRTTTIDDAQSPTSKPAEPRRVSRGSLDEGRPKVRKASSEMGQSPDREREENRDAAVLGFHRKLLDVGKSLNFGL